MAEINISTNRWEEMVREHSAAPHHGARFITWHSEFILRFHELLKTVPDGERPDRADIAAWTEVPVELKRVNGWDSDWDALEDRLNNNIGSFESLDELANEIYHPHNFLHVAAARAYNDRYVGNPQTAPRSTYFWQIHGLIELWHLNWRRALIV